MELAQGYSTSEREDLRAGTPAQRSLLYVLSQNWAAWRIARSTVPRTREGLLPLTAVKTPCKSVS